MTADLQDLFDRAGRNPPVSTLDADTVLRSARRHHRRRVTGAVAATAAVAVALVVGLAGQRLLSAGQVPATPVPTPTVAPALGVLGHLAYGFDGDIYVADGDGNNPVVVADGTTAAPDSCPTYWGEGPLWSPDGRYLAYRGESTSETGTATDCSWNRTVIITDADGDRVTSFPGDGWAVAWSPDSTRVAVWLDFYDAHTLGIFGLDGKRQAVLTVPAKIMPSGDFDPIWSPDGTAILLKEGVEVPVDGSEPRKHPAGDPRSQLQVSYSHDGTRIAYVSADGLCVANADGSQPQVLVAGSLENFQQAPGRPAWSPTGDRVAFVATNGPRTALSYATTLAVVDVATGSVLSLADTGGAYMLSSIEFSPEGDQLLFAKAAGNGENSLWSVRADGSDPHQLATGTNWGDWQTVIPTR